MKKKSAFACCLLTVVISSFTLVLLIYFTPEIPQAIEKQNSSDTHANTVENQLSELAQKKSLQENIKNDNTVFQTHAKTIEDRLSELAEKKAEEQIQYSIQTRQTLLGIRQFVFWCGVVSGLALLCITITPWSAFGWALLGNIPRWGLEVPKDLRKLIRGHGKSYLWWFRGSEHWAEGRVHAAELLSHLDSKVKVSDIQLLKDLFLSLNELNNDKQAEELKNRLKQSFHRIQIILGEPPTMTDVKSTTSLKPTDVPKHVPASVTDSPKQSKESTKRSPSKTKNRSEHGVSPTTPRRSSRLPSSKFGDEASHEIAERIQLLAALGCKLKAGSETIVDQNSFKNYQIKEILGCGGWGIVLKAVQTSLNRPVALKFLNPSHWQDDTLLEMLKTEGERIAALDNRYIVKIYNVEEFEVCKESKTIPFLVMEYLSQGTLEELIDSKRLPRKDVLRVGLKIAYGIRAMHTAHMRHGDLKPNNISAHKETIGTEIKIFDFGLAGTHSAYGSDLLGTYGYDAPEKNGQGKVGLPSDLFSLGCILFEMATELKMGRDIPLDRNERLSPLADINIGDELGEVLECKDQFPINFRNLIFNLLSSNLEVRPTISDVIDVLKNSVEQTDSL